MLLYFFSVACDWFAGRLFRATNIVEYMVKEYYRNVPTVLLAVVIPSGVSGSELSSRSLYCVTAPYGGLFHWWVPFCGFRGVGCWNFCRADSKYYCMEKFTVLLV